jgi:hypothetical protein
MIKKETHPDIFKKRTEAFKKAYDKHPNKGMESKSKDSKRIFSK